MKLMKLKKKDIKGAHHLNFSIKGTVPYRYFFKKIGDKVYKYSKIGDEEWREDLTPFEDLPF